MRRLVTSILILVCFNIPSLSAQTNNSQGSEFTIKSAPNEPAPDSITFVFLKGIINAKMGNKRIKGIKRSPDKSFTITFPVNQPVSPFYLQLLYKYNGKQIAQSTNIYYAEASDKIEILISKGKFSDKPWLSNKPKLSFSGNGADKYKVVDILDGLNKATYERLLNNYDELIKNLNLRYPSKDKVVFSDENLSNFKSYLNMIFESIGSDIKRNQDTLFKYKNQLGRKTAYFYSYEFNPYAFYSFFINRLLINNHRFENYQQLISDFYFSKINIIRPNPTDQCFKYGVLFRQSRSHDFMWETYYKTKGIGSPLHVQYNEIKSEKNIQLRDILITNFFVNPLLRQYVSNSESRDSCLNDALKKIKNIELKSALTTQLTFSKGSKMQDFSFPDFVGKKMSLTDLKGKVFILDFYYYGCAACAIFASQFEKEIYPEFANDPNFKVLSVNTDQTKERWMKAIQSGIYTHSKSINLSTGVAFSHPLFKYYNINSLPFVLLINKEGKLIARLNGISNAEIRKLIREALTDTVKSK